MILGEVKARPKDIISFSLDYISKSKVQTSNPSSSPISLDTPARPADFFYFMFLCVSLTQELWLLPTLNLVHVADQRVATYQASTVYGSGVVEG